MGLETMETAEEYFDRVTKDVKAETFLIFRPQIIEMIKIYAVSYFLYMRKLEASNQDLINDKLLGK